MVKSYDVIIIGGGASGMMSGIFCGRNGFSTLILEHNEKLGKKLYITGKGKCNLTNDSSIDNHIQNIITNPKFMYSALNSFSPADTIEFFEQHGLKLKTEQGRRVFPASYKSSDVIKTLVKTLNDYDVKVSLNTEILDVKKVNDKFNILCCNNIEYTCNSLIVATGGLSYAGTGATGLGYKIARDFGHNVIKPNSALCPIVVKEDVSTLNGISLRNITLNFKKGKIFISEFGDLLFTFNSLTGPIALRLSSKINKLDLNNTEMYIDFKPALTEQQLENKLSRELPEFSKKNLKSYILTLLPSGIVDFFMAKNNLENKKIADLSSNDRTKLINALKKFDFSIKSLDNINVSIVTSGGVDTKEINSKTMESKLVNNLYFVGEVIDVDALTGGYNLQIAWSTGYVAGNSIKG